MRFTITVLLASICTVASASTSFQTYIGDIQTSAGVNVSDGTVGILVADYNNDNNFAGSTAGTYSSIVGTVLTAGSSIGADRIVGIYTALGGLFTDTISVSYSGTLGNGVASGTKLALYWFPGQVSGGVLQAASVTQSPTGQSQMGFFRSDATDSLGGDQAFVLPADSGAFLNLYYGSPSQGGNTPQASFQAFNLSAVPEPSRAMLAGLGLMGLVIRRRRK